jgi:hypothetical protein
MAGKVGRPKKSVEVLSQDEKVIEVAQISEPTNEPGALNESAPVELLDNAYSITRDPETQIWMAVRIQYDVKSGTVGKIEVVEKNTERQIIIERFQILAGQEFMSS